jgi:hypothetical protein
MPGDCPGARDLRRWLEDEHDAPALEAHVETCLACQWVVEERCETSRRKRTPTHQRARQPDDRRGLRSLRQTAANGPAAPRLSGGFPSTRSRAGRRGPFAGDEGKRYCRAGCNRESAAFGES